MKEISRSRVQINYTTNDSRHEIKCSNNKENIHLGMHFPLIEALRQLSWVLAFTSEDLKKEAIKAFN